MHKTNWCLQQAQPIRRKGYRPLLDITLSRVFLPTTAATRLSLFCSKIFQLFFLATLFYSPITLKITLKNTCQICIFAGLFKISDCSIRIMESELIALLK